MEYENLLVAKLFACGGISSDEQAAWGNMPRNKPLFSIEPVGPLDRLLNRSGGWPAPA